MVAHILAAVAAAEREVICQRTSAALIAKRSRGEHVGRRSTLPLEVVERIVTARADGATLAGIAQDLQRDGVRTGQGGAHWHPSTVRAVLESRGGGKTSSGGRPPQLGLTWPRFRATLRRCCDA